MLTSPEESLNQDPIVVVGMGPGGIVAAIEAARKGHDVLLLEQRKHFTRTQRVVLSAETINYLEWLNEMDPNLKGMDPIQDKHEDFEFLKYIDRNGSNVEVNKLQEFLEKKCRILFPDRIVIKKEIEILENGIDTKNNTIAFKGEDKPINFKHLVGADGARHALADMVNQTFDETKITYNELEQQTRQESHGTVSLRVKENEPPPTTNAKKLSMDDPYIAHRLQSLGWDESYPPNIYIFPDATKKRFYIAGEIPLKILQETDKAKQTEQLVEWGKAILELQAGIKKVDDIIEFDVSADVDEKSLQENRLKATAFPVALQYATAPCVNLANESVFVLVGDAGKSANFFLGHGANDAIRDARKFGQCLEEEGFNSEAYLRHQREERDVMVTGMVNAEKNEAGRYSKQAKGFDALIVNQATILIKLAAPYKDLTTKILMKKCEKSLSKDPVDMNQVYDATIKLADRLNKISELQLDKIDANIKRKERKLDLLVVRQKIYENISSIASPIGKYLMEKSEIQRALLLEQASNLIDKKATLVGKDPQSQANLTKPHEYLLHKQELMKRAEAASKLTTAPGSRLIVTPLPSPEVDVKENDSKGIKKH